MKKIIMILVVIFACINYSEGATRVVRTVKNIPQSNYSYDYQNNMFAQDLSYIEDYLFATNYRNDALLSRLNRIEKKLFNQTYPTMNTAQRMNNILANYKDDYNNKNYLADYYGTNKNPAQRILNRFVGQPTGFTPSIVTTPFDSYGYPAGISKGYTSNRGYGYRNVVPANMGAGIHILD